MALFNLRNIVIRGVSAAVPKRKETTLDYELIPIEEREKIVSTTGVSERRIAGADICSSDLCYAAAVKLIGELGWDRNTIDLIIFVSQTPDYIFPATAPILQARLGLEKSCMSFDISMGCSGYVYGLSVIGSLLSQGSMKRGLLLVGDTISKTCSKEDKSTFPLFGDAGTATALEYSIESEGISFNLSSDGSDHRAIIIEDGGFRNQVSAASFLVKDFEGGIRRNDLNIALDGMNVFSFGINRAPTSITELLDYFKLNKESIDYFVFHQANMFMNEMIRQKLRIPAEKMPYSIKHFGNTSSATIPLTIVNNLKEQLKTNKQSLILCGFGVGLSWGSAYLVTDRIVCPEIFEI